MLANRAMRKPQIKAKKIAHHRLITGLRKTTNLTKVGKGNETRNKKTWDSLSPDLQKIVDAASVEFMQKVDGPMYDRMDKEALELDAKDGIEIIYLSQAEMDKIRAAAIPLWDKWVTEMNGLGLPGQAVMDKFKSLIQTTR